MRHPELMLSTNGFRVAVDFLHAEMTKFQKVATTFPTSTLLAEVAISSPNYGPQERAGIRELPYVLGLVKKLPIFWELETNFAKAMLATDPPEDHGLAGFRLPYPAIWVDAPPILNVFNQETGMHKLEGFYLAEDWVPSRRRILDFVGKSNLQISDLDEELQRQLDKMFVECLKTRPTDVMERAILVLMVGESHGPVVHQTIQAHGREFDSVWRDDALLSFWIFTEDAKRIVDGALEHTRSDATRLVTNLLMAIQSDYITHENVVPVAPKSPKKLAKAARHGKSFAPYSIIKLGSRKSGGDSATRSAHTEGTGKDRIIRGHWNHYWVLQSNVESDVVLGRKIRDNKEDLCKVRRWIRPIIIGNPDPKTYLIR